MFCNLKSNMVFLPVESSSIVMKIFGNSTQIRRQSSINYLEQMCTSLSPQLTLFHSIPVTFIITIKISAIKNHSFRNFDSQNPTVLEIFSDSLCQKSWNTYIISAAHLVVSPSPPQNNVVIYSVDRYRKSRYACIHFSGKYTLNPTLYLGVRGFQSFNMNQKIIFIRNYALIN